jgi:hypothetical protein
VPHFQVTRDEMEVPALKEASINQAPRLAFTPEGDLVKDIKYQRGVDGLVEGAKVVVVKVLEQNQKRRKVVSQEKGVITRVHNNNNVQVDFGKDGSKEEITVPISSLSVVVQSGKRRSTMPSNSWRSKLMRKRKRMRQRLPA